MALEHGFELLREEEIPELKTLARIYRHAATGAELLSLINDDENKVFGIVFRTPPRDSTGVAHILEHSVLCGSRKYPVKEPFVELLKGSLKTFLNAFTYPDKTCYPVASQNLQDFYNLIDVYLDAVFHPRITPRIFEQEGWHYDIEDPRSPLSFKGVVYNEMKGAYSSPDTLLAEYSQQSLFPDITYGLDSGGDPKVIPTLTYEQFKSFHERFYHPSNARIFFYGDDDPEQRLRLMNESLRDFRRREADSAIPIQPPFESPREQTRFYAATGESEEGASGASKAMVTVNWLLCETLDPEMNLALSLLNHSLLGMPGAPLRKALIESGLGDDLAGHGLEDELRQMFFSVGLKGIQSDDSGRVEKLILDTLAQLAREGIDDGTVEASLNTLEFRLRENNTGMYPRGLVLMLRALTTWLYEGDPLALLAFEKPLAAVKARIAADRMFLPRLIDSMMLQNPHRTTILLKPDPNLGEQQEALLREKLEALKQTLSDSEIRKLVEDTLELRELQTKPDPPEALATIPMLKVEDLERTNKVLPIAVDKENRTTLLTHDVFTNGILYLDLGLDLHVLPRELVPYTSLIGRTFIEMGTDKEDYVLLSQRIGRKTGGIFPELFASTKAGSRDAATWLFLRGKAMTHQATELLDILRDLLLAVRLDNPERFRQMLLEEKARVEQRLVPNGHQFVSLRIKSHFSESDWFGEQVSGISYLFFLRDLVRKVDEDWPAVLRDLESIRSLVIDGGNMIANVTCDAGDWGKLESRLRDFIRDLPQGPGGGAPQPVSWQRQSPPLFEGLSIPSQVNYVGKGMNLLDLGKTCHGSALVATGYLRTTWLWERVRVQGGAYGAFSQLDRHSGTLVFVSYRDPNLQNTLDIFDRSGEFLCGDSLSDEEISKAIVGTIGQLDAHLLPDAKGYKSTLRFLKGETEEDRQRLREEVLATTSADFKAFADVLDDLKERGIVKVLGSDRAIEASLAEKPGWLNVLKVL
jgi:Zn-dependent M16 (insulinase) family peptidase